MAWTLPANAARGRLGGQGKQAGRDRAAGRFVAGPSNLCEQVACCSATEGEQVMRLSIGGCAALAIFAAVMSNPALAESPGGNPGSQQIAFFFDTLKTGSADAAVTSVLDTSPLWSNRTGVKEQMVAQIDAATKIYGGLASYECVPALRTGTLVIRQYCYAQHQQMVLRWQFDLAKLPSGWAIAFFGFNDQANSWPDGG